MICRRGHDSPKNSSGACRVCVRIKERERYYANPEKTKARIARRNKDHEAAKMRRYRAGWSQEKLACVREKAKLKAREWRRNNPGHRNALKAAYKAARRNAVPVWANHSKIKEIYLACPPGFHVDHIIPIRGRNVCGLHVEANLQYLPAVENLRKNRSFA